MELMVPGALDESLAQYPDPLGPDHIAEILHVDRQTVIRGLGAGRIPGYKFGNRWVTPRASMRDALRAGANTAALALEQGEVLSVRQALNLPEETDDLSSDD